MTSATAELANGVATAETAFLRPPPVGMPRRVAHTEQYPTLLPWQHGLTDPVFVSNDTLKNWRANANVLELPPPPERRTRVPAEISGVHASSVDAWRRSEVPLSQWELTERGDSLVEANKLSSELERAKAKEELAKLLTTTERVSRAAVPARRARWLER